jgi:hypothetical protein
MGKQMIQYMALDGRMVILNTDPNVCQLFGFNHGDRAVYKKLNMTMLGVGPSDEGPPAMWFKLEGDELARYFLNRGSDKKNLHKYGFRLLESR